ncbi:MAG: permease-like cell division protein FtsX [Bacteroidota bacterium]
MANRTGSRPNYLYSIISVTLVLLLLGLFGLLVLQGQEMIKQMKEQVEVIIEIEEESTEQEVDELKGFLSKSLFYKEGSARFISKADGAKMMQEEFGDAFLKLDMANPLYDVLTFNMNADFVNTAGMEEAESRIRGFGQVSDVYYQESVTDAIAANLHKISYGVLIAGLFFIVVAVALILNTIRLALYANRFLIKNMELVGASWGFISRPFLKRSFWHGLICGLIAVAILCLLLYVVFGSDPDLQAQLFIPGIAVLFAALLISGVLITVLSTYYVVNKYLKMRVDDLY